MTRRLLPLALLPALVLAGCAGSPAAGTSDDGRVRVVASTDVWGDVVRQIGGDDVQVDSIITDPDRDPHEYQADPRDRLAVSRAQLVVVNGGHYDDFMEQLTAGLPDTVPVLDAVTASGLDDHADGSSSDDHGHDHGEFNEHVWYSLDGVEKVAEAVESDLARLAPQHRADFATRLDAFQEGVADLRDQQRSLRATAQGKGVAITEPVPLYLTEALGLVDRTPAAFSEAIEEGDDVAPAVLRQQLALFSEHRVAVLAVNLQTSDATTQQVVAAAKAADVPVVGVRETLPDGQDWLTWMAADLKAMRTALGG